MADVLATLALLGDTPNDVAACLANKGIRGERGSYNSCPVAVFLVNNGIANVVVGGVLAKAVGRGAKRESVVMPPAVVTFIFRFDAGEWPELVEDADA